MNAATLTKALKSNKINGDAKANVIALAEGRRKVRTCHTTGNGRFTSNSDSTKATMEALDTLGLTFTTGNDAPRGGLTGNWIDLTPESRRRIAPIAKAAAVRDRIAAEDRAAEQARAIEAEAKVEVIREEARVKLNTILADKAEQFKALDLPTGNWNNDYFRQSNRPSIDAVMSIIGEPLPLKTREIMKAVESIRITA